MTYRHMRYPEGKAKAVTLSYDDGSCHDIRLAELCNRYGLKCTFNINSARIAPKSGEWHLPAEEIEEHLLNAGHEIAVHGHEHKAPGLCTPIEIIEDVLTCRKALETRFGRIIRGMAYPDSGIRNTTVTPYAQIRQILVELGIAYARTLGGDNDKFSLPEDWYAWVPTAHHDNPHVLDYAKAFTEMDCDALYVSQQYPKLFYLWGHSFEFDGKQNWEHFEQLCQILGGHDNIWYATNIEVYDYVQAYRALQFSADGTRVYNPTLQKVWFQIAGIVYAIAPNETLLIG